ncbi:trypsin Inhibitor like cysteine rich domain protein [Cooperia oncophora]
MALSNAFAQVDVMEISARKKASAIKYSSEFDESLYNMKEVENNKIFWRILNDEIEVVLRYPGESWAAIGWKPQDAQCSQIADQFKQPSSEFDAAFPTVFYSIDKYPYPAQGRDKATRSASRNDDYWDYDSNHDQAEGFVRMTNDEEACVPFDFCDKEAEPSCPTNSTWAKCGTACEPSCANMYDTAPCPATCEKSACTCADNYVRYEGACIYWGDCPDIDSHFHSDSSSNHTTEIMHVPSVSDPNSLNDDIDDVQHGRPEMRRE